MSSRKGKVAGDTEEKVAGDRESNKEEKRGKKTKKKQRGERFICSEKGEKRESPTKKIKCGKKQRRNREERVLYALKVSTTTNLPKQCHNE